MAINDIVQTIAEARVDARSLSEFVFKPAGFKVARRLAPPVDTLQFYINRFNGLNGDFSSSVSVALSSLNNSVAEADDKVAYIETTVQDAINNTAVDGGILADTFVTATANGVGAVARTQRDKNADLVSVKDFGAKGNGVTDDTTAVQKAADSELGYLYFPSGKYLISDAITIKPNTKIFGLGVSSEIVSTGTNKNIFHITSANHVHVDSLKITGNNTGTGTVSNTKTGGNGVYFINSDYGKVTNCTFDKIGTVGTGYTSCIKGVNANKVEASGNVFLSDCYSNAGSDIDFTYYCSGTIVTNNYSRSEMDTFISLAAVVNGGKSSNYYHIVANNIGVRKNGSASRNGIITMYDGRTGLVNVTGNILSNFPCCGIYVSAATSAVGSESSGVTITGNTVVSCGGINKNLGLEGGIYLSGEIGNTCTGNFVWNTGYDLAGNTRAVKAPAILIWNMSQNIVCTSNVVNNTYGYGVEIRNQSGQDIIDGVVLSGNSILNSKDASISIFGAGASSRIDNLKITNNLLKSKEVDCIGIKLEQYSDFLDMDGFLIQGNTITGVGKATSTVSAIKGDFSSQSPIFIKDNIIKGFKNGLNVGVSSYADKYIGNTIIIDSNSYEDCMVGESLIVGGDNVALTFNSKFKGCDFTVSDPERIFSSTEVKDGIFNVYVTTMPTKGVWAVGSRAINLAPVAAGVSQWVCTASPATWEPEITLPA